MQLRPSLWVVVFAILEEQARSWNWFQDDPTHATVQQVIEELIAARSVLEKGPSMYIGEMRAFATADAPEGWLRCDGATYANVDYPLLAAAIHPGYVVDADNFRVPDGDQRAFVDGFYPGTQGGEATHVLTEEEMPAHTHSYNEPSGEFIALTGEEPVVLLINPFGTTGSTGGGEAHNNMQPYEGTQWYIRAAWPTAGG